MEENEKVEAEQQSEELEAQDESASVSEQSEQTDAEEKDSSTDSNEEKSAPESESQEASNEENVPFHKHPRFREITKQNREFAKELKQLRSALQERTQTQANPQPQGDTLSPQEREALIKLANMMSQDDEARKALGLDRISQIEKESQSMRQARNTQIFESEKSAVLKEAEQLGLDKDEVEDLVESSFDFSNTGDYEPRTYQMAFRSVFWDRLGELRERKANLANIQEKKKLKNGSVEQSAKGGPSKGPAVPSSGNLVDQMDALMRAAGGPDNVDFDK